MIVLKADHNLEGQAQVLWGTFAAEGWLELIPMRLLRFRDVQLSEQSSDRDVRRFAQQHGMLLLTDNRNMAGADSLEKTIRAENQANSLPVLTVGRVDRLVERNYREQCAARVLEILVDIDRYLGTGRLYLP